MEQSRQRPPAASPPRDFAVQLSQALQSARARMRWTASATTNGQTPPASSIERSLSNQSGHRRAGPRATRSFDGELPHPERYPAGLCNPTDLVSVTLVQTCPPARGPTHAFFLPDGGEDVPCLASASLRSRMVAAPP